jgi:hypothetical protein
MDWTSVERAVMESALSQAVEGMDTLRRQFACAAVVEREHTGVGFYTTMSVPHSVPPVPNTLAMRQALFNCGSARVTSDPEELICFHLWLDEGYLCTLEGFTTKRDYWPNESDIEVCPR